MTAPPSEGYLHEVGFYASDEEFADLIVPFAREGIAADEPVIFAYDAYKSDLLRDWLPEDPRVTYITDAGPYATPAKALKAWRSLIQDHLAAGASRVRIAGNVPHPGYGVPYAGWDRYEAAVDRAIGDLPVWAPCLYDTRIAPADVIDRARSLHHTLRQRDGSQTTNADYQARTGLVDFLVNPPDPLEQTAPSLDLDDPDASAARDAIRALVGDRLCERRLDHVLLAVSEALTNARLHGQPPIWLRAWRGEDRLVVHVHDCGHGPADPLAGLLPYGELQESGRGLWIAHQLDIDLALVPDAEGFTVRVATRLD